jgi:hypothetical protein
MTARLREVHQRLRTGRLAARPWFLPRRVIREIFFRNALLFEPVHFFLVFSSFVSELLILRIHE